MSESILIKKIQEGEVSLFSELVNQNKNLVYSLVLKMVKNSQDAEEVAQDAFIKAFKSIKQFKEESKFSTWIYKISYFCAIDHLRKKKQLTSNIDLISIQSDDDSVLDTINLSERKEVLLKALDLLKPIDRNLISMFYMEELSIQEIEKITLFTKSNIKVKLMRIRKQLNGILTAMMKDELENFIK